MIERISKKGSICNERKSNKLKIESDSHSTTFCGKEGHKIKKDKVNVKQKLSDGQSLESESQKFREIENTLASKRLKN